MEGRNTVQCNHCAEADGLWGGVEVGRPFDDDGWMIHASWSEDSASIPIRFCPFCGKRLDDNREDGDGR